jgi:hypothetical protein
VHTRVDPCAPWGASTSAAVVTGTAIAASKRPICRTCDYMAVMLLCIFAGFSQIKLDPGQALRGEPHLKGGLGRDERRILILA